MILVPEWRSVDGWPGYEVSNLGEVRSVTRVIVCSDGQRQTHKGQVLKQWTRDFGYKRVHLRGVGRDGPAEAVHRLVAKAFVPNPEGKPGVNHIDNNTANNRADNLEWCTQAENLAHAERQGRLTRDYWKGRRSPNAYLSDQDVKSIRDEYAKGGVSWAALGEKFGISKRSVGRIVRGKSYGGADV